MERQAAEIERKDALLREVHYMFWDKRDIDIKKLMAKIKTHLEVNNE